MFSEINNMAYDTMIAQRVTKLQTFQKREIYDFVNYLLSKPSKQSEPRKREISFEWEGALAKVFANESSVDLQHKIWEYKKQK